MKSSFIFSLRILITIFCCIPTIIAGTVPSEILSTSELIKALQSGGHIIYMRHGATDHTQNDKKLRNFENCNTQRNLSTEGREQVKQIGRTIRALGIPLGDVSSSPYCRCKDTAKLVFGQYHVVPDLQFSISKNKEESEQLGERLHTMMMKSNDDSNNVVFVGHTSNLRDGLGVWPKPEGAMAIFKKREHRLIFKGIVKPDEWPKP